MLQQSLFVGVAALLAKFELALQRLDLYFESNDASQHRRNIALRQLGEAVAGALSTFKFFNQPTEQLVQSGLIGNRGWPSRGMNHREVPCRHGLLLRIPRRRDVPMWATEDDDAPLATR